MTLPYPIRKECPPGACVCHRERLLDDPSADIRVLRLTQEEEKKLIGRIDSVATLPDLQRLTARMQELLGIAVEILPSERGVRTVRGFQIEVTEQDGLCRKTRQAIPAAIRRCLDRQPEIAFAILDSHGLLGSMDGGLAILSGTTSDTKDTSLTSQSGNSENRAAPDTNSTDSTIPDAPGFP